MQYVVTKGKNITEAIYSGLSILDSPKQNVNIEVLQKEKERLFFSKKAVVKLTRKEKKTTNSISSFVDDFFITQSSEHDVHSEMIGEMEGKAWIKKGKVFCKTTKGIFPTLTIPENMVGYINGEAFNGNTIVLSDNENYEVLSQDVLQDTEWTVSMDTDKIEVYLHVKPGFLLNYNLLDSEPKQHLVPSVIENKQTENSLQLKEIIEEMAALRVTTGFHHAEMVKATQSTEDGIYIIASGKPPQKGENGWFESKVNTKVEKGLKENEEGKVDFREVKTIPIVDKGYLIGIIHPPTLGQIGYTVTNEPIPCKQTYPLKVKAGNGIIIIDDKVIATEAGRPHIEQRGLLVKISIIQKFTHVGNVDLSSGNITFKGDVEVLGEVADHMSVDAFGEVEIHKSVNNATVTANESVSLHSNCNGSTIFAGKDFLTKERIERAKSIIQTMDRLFALLAIVTSSEAFKNSPHSNNIQTLVRSLIVKKFDDFPNEVKSLFDTINVDDDHLQGEEWKRIRNGLKRCFLSLTVDAKYEERLQQLYENMKNLVESNSESDSSRSFVTMPNAMNSKILCNGDVSIIDKGCINTEIQAGGHVLVAGIARGGKIFGERGITVGEAGSVNSSLTVLATTIAQSIQIGRAMEGVVLKIGKQAYQFSEEAYNVKAYIDTDGKMIVNFR